MQICALPQLSVSLSLVSLILSPLSRISHLCGAQHRTGDKKTRFHYWISYFFPLRNKPPVKWIFIRQLEVWESENQVTYSCWSSEGTRCQQTPFDQFDLPKLRGNLQTIVTTHPTQAYLKVSKCQVPYFNEVFSSCFRQSTPRVLRDWSHLKRCGPILGDLFA